MPDIRLLNPNDLIFIQSRADMNFSLVDEYAEMMVAGMNFDHCFGIQTPDGSIFVWDGFHRGEAAKKAGCFLDVEIIEGTKEEAEWRSFSANIKHGLRRSRKDLERIVKNALKHPQGVELSNRLIADHCGCDEKTVRNYRKELESSAEIPKTKTRKVKRNDQDYTMSLKDKPDQQNNPTPEQDQEIPFDPSPPETSSTVTCEKCGTALPSKKLVELVSEDGIFLCQACKSLAKNKSASEDNLRNALDIAKEQIEMQENYCKNLNQSTQNKLKELQLLIQSLDIW